MLSADNKPRRGFAARAVLALFMLVATTVGTGLVAQPAEAVYPPQYDYLGCSSNNYLPNWCAAPSGQRLKGVVLDFQFSNASCIQGQTWGWNQWGIYVSGGCRARFQVSYTHKLELMNCSSWWYNRSTCYDRWNRQIDYVTLKQRYSSSPCIQGTSWWHNPPFSWPYANSIVVERGCRAQFLVWLR